MRLTELFSIAFERGCNKNLADMRATNRFSELWDEFAHALDPDLAATTQLLGEELIAEATSMLPLYLLKLADDWRNRPAESQLLILELLYQELEGSHQEDEKLEAQDDETQAPSRFLPAEFGPWPTGAVRPSCLGIGILLMAFAKRCGAPHWFAHVLFTHHKATAELQLELVQPVRDFLYTQLPAMAAKGELKSLDDAVSAALDNLALVDSYLFHPALIIQISDGRWALIDPYLHVRSLLHAEDWPVNEAASQLRNNEFGQVATVSSRVELERVTNRLFDEGNALSKMLQGFNQRQPATYNRKHMFEAAALVHQSARQKHLRWIAELLEDWDEDLIMMDGLLPSPNKLYYEVEEYRKAIEQLETDPEYARLVVERIVALPLRRWLRRVWNDIETLWQTLPHISLELTDPANGVATGVLNNLRCFLHQDPIEVDGELVLLTDSQSVWHDTMAEVHGHKSLAPRVAECLRVREETLRTYPRELLHPGVAQLLAASKH